MKKRILLTGASGLISNAIIDRFPNHFDLILTSRTIIPNRGFKQIPFDLENIKEIPDFLKRIKPDVIIHTAAIGSVDVAENHQEKTDIINAIVPGLIATWCQSNGVRLIHFSTDFVFNGLSSEWVEESAVEPLSYYGLSKAKSEKLVAEALHNHVIIRPVLVYGSASKGDRLSLPELIIQRLKEGKPMEITADQYRKPTYVRDIADSVIALINSSYRGKLHLCGNELVSVFEFARLTSEVFNLDQTLLTPVSGIIEGQKGKRPHLSGLNCELAKRIIDFNPLTLKEGLMEMKSMIKG